MIGDPCAYTPLEVIAEWRDRVDDTGGNVGPPSAGFTYYWEEDDSTLLWSNREAMRYLQYTIDDFSVRQPFYDDTYGGTVTQIAISPNIREYRYDPRILEIRAIYLRSTGRRLRKQTEYDMHYQTPRFRELHGEPTRYIDSNTRDFVIVLDYMPLAPDYLDLIVRRRSLERITPETMYRPIAEPDDIHREALIQGMMAQGFNKRDCKSYNPNEAQQAAQMFEELVGPRPSARQLYNRRKNANMIFQPRPWAYYTRRRERQAFWS